MGTRANFFVGRNNKAEWVGSVAMDGYLEGIDEAILNAETEGEFRDAVEMMLSECNHATKPEQGWPWPWEDPATNDFTYAYDYAQVWYTRCSAEDGWDRVYFWKEHQKEDDCRVCKCPKSRPKLGLPMMDTNKFARAGTNRAGNILIVGGA